MPRKTRKRVKPKGHGNSIKFKHRSIRGGSTPERTITKRTNTRSTISKVSPSDMPTSGIKWSRRSAEERKKNQKVLNLRGSTTRASPELVERAGGQPRSRKTIMEDLQSQSRKKGGRKTRKKGGRKTRKKGNKSMKRRC